MTVGAMKRMQRKLTAHRRPMTPMDVLRRPSFAARIQGVTMATRRVNVVYWWLLLIAATVGVMFVVSAGNTPKSYAQTTEAEPSADNAVDRPSEEDWEKLAECEAQGDWSINTGNGYSGGLQFDEKTWDSYGNGGKAHEASKEDQIKAGEKIWLDGKGWGAWPSCKDKLSLTSVPNDKSKDLILADDSESASPDSEDSETTETNDSSDSGSTASTDIRPRSRETTEDSETNNTAPNSSAGVIANSGIVSDEMKEPGFASPLAYASAVVKQDQFNTVQSASKYLASTRWRDANLYSYAPFKGGMDALNGVSNTLTAVAFLMTGLASAVFYGVQLLLMYALSIDFFSKGAYVVNSAFFKAGSALFSIEQESDGSYSYSMPILVVYAIGFTLLATLIGFALRGRQGREGLLRIAAMSLIFSSLAIWMVVRASDNVSVQDGGTGKSDVAEPLRNANLVQITSADNETVETASKSSNWSVGSPGWIMTILGSLSSSLSGFVGQITMVISNAVTSSMGQEMSQCDIYINGMHAAFAATPVAQTMGEGRVMTLIAYDRMVNSLFLQNYAAGAMSDTLGAQNAWCRMAEVDTNRPPGEQAMISRVAGLNREAVGTGGFGLIETGSGVRSDDLVANTSTWRMPNRGGSSIQVTSGELVAESGEWNFNTDGVTVGQDAGDGTGDEVEGQRSVISIASQYFGPNYGGVNPKAARDQARFYWAVCEWGKSETNEDVSDDNDRASFYPGREATVNPEWRNVVWAKGDSNRTFTKEDCASQDIISSQPNKGFGEAWTSDNVDSKASAHFEFLHESAQVESEGGDEGDEGLLDQAADWLGDKWSKTWRSIPGVGSVGTATDAMGDVMDWLTRSSPTAADMHGSRFQSAVPMVGGDSAMTYLQRANGEKPMGGIITAAVSLLLAYVIARMVGGLIIGGLIVNVMMLLVFAFGVLFLLLAMVPVRPIRNGLRNIGKTAIASTLTDGFMVFVFGAVFAFNELLRAMILPVVQDVLSSAILGGVIALLAFYSFNLLIRQFTQLDMTKISDAIKLAPIAASPALARMGFMARNPFDIAKNGLGRLGLRRGNRNARRGQSRVARKNRDQEARQRVRNDYGDDRGQRQRERDEADDRRRQKQKDKQEERKKKRQATDATLAVASATPAAPYAKAGGVATKGWRGLTDGVRKVGGKTADTTRKVARKLRDGASYSHEQADLIATGKAGYISDVWKRRTGSTSPGEEATATDTQRERTGQIFVDEDNVDQFDSKVPGSFDNSGQTQSDDPAFQALLDQHADLDPYGEGAPDGFFGSPQAAYDAADRASAPEVARTMPVGRPVGRWSPDGEQRQVDSERRMQEAQERMTQRQANSTPMNFTDDQQRTGNLIARGLGRDGDPAANRRDAAAREGGKGFVARMARAAADRMENNFRSRFDDQP